MGNVWPVLAGVLAALITGYWSNRNTRAQLRMAMAQSEAQLEAAREQTSGTVDTADARTIFEAQKSNFDQGDALRKELREIVGLQAEERKRQDAEIARCGKEIEYLRGENHATSQEIATTKQELESQALRFAAVEEHVRLCEEKLARLRRKSLTVLTEEEEEEERADG